MTSVLVTGLTKRFNGVAALNGVELAAAPGELVTLLGPSGCGKTTTLRCIAGFLDPDGGDIRVDGRSICGTRLRDRNFGVVFQNYALFPHMTVRQNVAYGLRVRRVARAELNLRAAEAMAKVGLDHLADRLPRTLSGGQQQRVALARALVIRPLLLLLDEPLANLDATLRQEMRALIRSVQQDQGITAFYVTHDQAEAMAISDRVAVMEKGRVAQFAPPREIYQRPVSRYVAAFTGEANHVPVQLVAAAGEGRYRVMLGGAEFIVSGPPALSGPTRLLMIRPEAASFAETGIPGLVRSVTFTGATQLCDIALDGGTLSIPTDSGTLSIPTDANRRVVRGDAVFLHIDPALGWLLPETPA